MSFILEGNKYGGNSKERAEWAKQALLDKYSGFLAENGLSIAFAGVGESAGQFGTNAHAGVPASFYTTPSSSFKNNATPSKPISTKGSSATQKENSKGGTTTGPKETSKGTSKAETTRVGRWMSEDEYEKMIKSGYVQKPYDADQSYVANPASFDAFYKQAPKGSVYVEFDVLTSSLRQTKDVWATIPGPNSVYSKLLEKKGLPPIKSFPKVENIKKIGVKE